MVEIVKNVIKAGGYKLSEMQHKIKKMYLLGDLTESEMDELLALASGGVSSDAERPEMLAMVKGLSDKIEALAARVARLEGTETDEEAAYPAWEPWDGLSNNYQYDAIVTHNGKLWQSKCEGQNVWEPGTAGTEGLWVEYTE